MANMQEFLDKDVKSVPQEQKPEIDMNQFIRDLRGVVLDSVLFHYTTYVKDNSYMGNKFSGDSLYELYIALSHLNSKHYSKEDIDILSGKVSTLNDIIRAKSKKK